MPTIALSGVAAPEGHKETMPSGLRRPAVLAAASLHLAVFLWLFHPWRGAPEHLPPADLPVTLIFEPPAPPPTAPEPRKAPQVGGDRSSGPDEQTSAPPSGEADEVKNEDMTAALEPEPPSPTQNAEPPRAPAPAIVAEPPAPPPPEPPRPAPRPKEEKTAAAPPPRTTATTPHPRKPPSHVALGERRTTGDPYLNAIIRELDKHRIYPDLARPLGLSGVVQFVVLIDRAGKLIAMRLVQSSGSELLDRAAERTIRETLPFPPAPSDYPGETIEITMGIYEGPS